ncbi:hypothetical protein B2J86_09460 [Acidovorax sp. SRB_14]|uniref:hypothetical protein n=1 Tax=unclassified Acidovorax TaxID=2684926 RepID=UPI001980DEB4|nr:MULTISPECIES: hypothetical protein [unclassified Acidovorax]NMM78718.1 hypothetical protein [Acidovorax sp. SRB_24]NMM81147.1 hypothetical protein [Acidovorax sp. SRB_14]NMM90311.1 hypothetical protein [Rhodococcus sp. SRB_17]
MQPHAHPTDFLLLQIGWPETSAADAAQAEQATGTVQAALAHSPLGLRVQRSAWSPALRSAYLYCALAQRTALAAADLAPLQATLESALPGACEVLLSRLELVFERAGHSSGAVPTAHYVVEMDPEDGWMPEIARWYDGEHMPGLAAVPGCIHARRLLNHDHGPLSLACYDLVTAEALGSPAWLAVRATAWSDTTRPHFTNTQRTMFRALAAP